MLPWEWHHFQQRHLGNGTGTGGAMSASHLNDITIRAVYGENEREASQAETGFNLTEHVVEIDAGADELQDWDNLAERPILFLDSLVHVNLESLDGAQEQSEADQVMQQECAIMNVTVVVQKYDLDSWNFGDSLKFRMTPQEAVTAYKPESLRKGKLHRHVHLSIAAHHRFTGRLKKHLSTG